LGYDYDYGSAYYILLFYSKGALPKGVSGNAPEKAVQSRCLRQFTAIFPKLKYRKEIEPVPKPGWFWGRLEKKRFEGRFPRNRRLGKTAIVLFFLKKTACQP
jgi:hypothetical protein